MAGRILQISVSGGGVPKLPIPEGFVTFRGLEGDRCRNMKYHGGPKQAVLLITSEGLDELKGKGFPVYPGALGENFTTHGLDRRIIRIGQRVRVGDALIEITKVRVPCSTLDPYGRGVQAAMYDRRVKAGDFSSARWGLSGFYGSVIETGCVRTNDIIAVVDHEVSQPHVKFA